MWSAMEMWGLKFAVRLALEDQGFVAFEISDELVGCQDGADFHVTVFFRKLDALAGFEIKSFTDLLWYDDLEFG